jgi:hypothetical protein
VGGFRENIFWVSGGRRPRRRRRRSGQSVDPVIVIRDLRGGRAEQPKKKGGEDKNGATADVTITQRITQN